jgi:hypothetical protein
VWATPRDLTAPVPAAGAGVSAADHLMDLVAQLLVHAWDLGRATGVAVVVDADLVAPVAEHARRRPVPGGVPGVDPAVRAAGPDADPWVQLLAAHGREA